MQSKPHPLKGRNSKLAIGNSITVTRGFCPGTGGKACDSKRQHAHCFCAVEG
jgi:hypothetical protein